jgi:aspartyl protease family protein
MRELDAWDQGQFWYLVVFIVLVMMGLVPRLKAVGFGAAIQMALAWLAIIGGLVLVIAKWQDIRAAVDPSTPRASGDAIRVAARADGHFYVRSTVNGVPVLFMVDTGASDVVLTRETATRIGLTDGELAFNDVVTTASGVARTAPVRIDSIEVGSIRLDDVRGSVSEGGLDVNLLGMAFLNRLGGWRVEQGQLILQP